MQKQISTFGWLVCIMLLFALSGCAGWHPYDNSQVPVVTVSKGLQPVISWTPAEVYELHIYPGSEDGDGLGAIWTAKMGGDYANTLISPLTYGVAPAGADLAPAPPLEEGQTYTVVAVRKDPLGEGDGFQNTRHRYVGKITFVATKE